MGKEKAVITLVPEPRRWWQRRKLRMHCSCGWRSKETWDARTFPELAHIEEMTRKITAQLHFEEAHPLPWWRRR